MIFTDKILTFAIRSTSGELAWKKEYVLQAIDELIDKGYAILGGDVWAIVGKNENDLTLLNIDYENIAVGVIKGKDGLDYVFNWYSTKKTDESWQEYALRSKIETINSINQMNAENFVAKEYEKSIYYNLVFADKSEYENLK